MSTTLQAPILKTLSDELAATRHGVDALAGLVSSYVRHCPIDERPAALQEAQAVDALSQHLEALAAFVGGLARGEALEQAIDSVPLADLADRLRGGGGGGAPVRSGGELQLFD
jgi:hypothetical protein